MGMRAEPCPPRYIRTSFPSLDQRMDGENVVENRGKLQGVVRVDTHGIHA